VDDRDRDLVHVLRAVVEEDPTKSGGHGPGTNVPGPRHPALAVAAHSRERASVTQLTKPEQAGVLVLGKILATLSELIAPIALVRLLPKVEVGILAEVLLIYTTLALLLTTGFPTTVLYYLPGRPASERRAIAWQLAKVMTALGAIGGALLLAVGLISVWAPDAFEIFASSVGRERSSFLYLAGLALFPVADVPARMLPNLCVVENRPRAAAWVGVFRGLGMSAGVLIPVALTASLWWIVVGVTVFGFLFGVLTLHYLRSLYSGVPRIPSPTRVRDLFRFGVPLGLTDVVSNLNGRVDRFLIFLLFTEATFAEYQAGAWQIPMITSIPYLAIMAYAPQLTELFKNGRTEDAIRIWREATEKIALLVVPIAMVFVVAAEEIIELLFTADYLRGAAVFRWYAIMTLGRVTAFGTVIACAGRPEFLPRAAAIAMASNILLSVPLVLSIGFVGPALGTALAFLPMTLAYTYYIARAAGLPFERIFPLAAYSRILGLALVAAAGALLFKWTTDAGPAVALAVEVTIVLGAFSLLGTAVGMIRGSDWRFLVDWFRLKALRNRRGG
jgi:O-antigen/teichoic acid export membrane protein